MVQRLPSRLYERFGPRVVYGGFALTCIAGAGTMTATSLWAGRYLHLPGDKLWAAVGIASAWLILLVPLLALTVHRPLRTVLSWSASNGSAAPAQEVWAAVVRVLARVPLWAPIALALGVPIVATVKLVTGISFASAAGEYLAGLVGTCAGIVPLISVFELLMRPMLEDVAAHLPADFEPAIPGKRLRTKALAAISSVALFSALTAGAFDTVVASGPLRMVIAVGVALATIAIAGGIFWLLMRSLLEPVDDLLAATKRVSRGDIRTAVPVVTGDEFGSLAAGFNRMLADLRRHEAELQQSRARIVAAADDARRRVERDLHDGAQQQLVLLGMRVATMKRIGERDPAAALAMLDDIGGDVEVALRELRDLAHGLYPQLLASDGLRGALREAAARSTISTEVDGDGAGRYPNEVEAAVYFCCLEALQNASKHAGAGATARISVGEADECLSFEVTDNGVGFSPNGRSATSGLQNMIDRIGALGGALRVTSEPGSGTTISGTVPLRG